MYKLFKKGDKSTDLSKVWGLGAGLALVLSLLAPGLFGIGAHNASAQTATTTSITVEKVVVGGGPLVADDFELFVNGSAVTNGVPLVFASTSIPSAPLTISETPVAGYTAAFSGDCDASGEVTISEGDELTCTITNTYTGTTTATTTDPVTSITVNKVVNGGDMAAGDFELFVNSTSVTNGVALTFASTSVPTSPLTISETPVAGYSSSFSGDCDTSGEVTLTLGDELECTITNTWTGTSTATTTATTTLTVNKVVNGGDMDAGDFELFVNGMAMTNGVATTTLAAGTYTVTETDVDGYTASFSGDCSATGIVNLLEGNELTCTITNTWTGSSGGGGGGSSDSDDDDNNITINVDGSSASSGDVNVNVNPANNPFPFLVGTGVSPQVLGAQSFVPYQVPFTGQVMGAQSYVPGLPTTGAGPEASATANLPLIALAGLMGLAGAGLILSPSASPSLRGRSSTRR